MRVEPIKAHVAINNQLPRFTVERAKMYEKESVKSVFPAINGVHNSIGLYNKFGKIT